MATRRTGAVTDGAWHEAHRMPERATFEQRVDWHAEHQRVCGCRPPPPAVAAELSRRAEQG